MIVYTIEEYYGDEYEGAFVLIDVTSDKVEADGYNYTDNYRVTEWEV